MKKIQHYTFYKEFNFAPEENPVLITVIPLCVDT